MLNGSVCKRILKIIYIVCFSLYLIIIGEISLQGTLRHLRALYIACPKNHFCPFARTDAGLSIPSVDRALGRRPSSTSDCGHSARQKGRLARANVPNKINEDVRETEISYSLLLLPLSIRRIE